MGTFLVFSTPLVLFLLSLWFGCVDAGSVDWDDCGKRIKSLKNTLPHSFLTKSPNLNLNLTTCSTSLLSILSLISMSCLIFLSCLWLGSSLKITELRVSGCTTQPCIFFKGKEYAIEFDAIPSKPLSLSISISISIHVSNIFLHTYLNTPILSCIIYFQIPIKYASYVSIKYVLFIYISICTLIYMSYPIPLNSIYYAV